MSNKTILITGAAKRIGAAITSGLHDAGMNVIIHYNTSSNEAQALSTTLNRKRPDSAHLIQANLLETDSLAELVDKAYAINQRLDVLINNASVFYATPVNDISANQWEEVMGINVKAPLFLIKHAAPYLAVNKGCIINLADIHAKRPLKNYPLYSISQSGLIMLTKALAKELGPAIRVNAISPGAILWAEKMDDDKKKMILARTVLGHQGSLAEIVNATHYLIEDTEYMTGQVLTIDGGRTLFS